MFNSIQTKVREKYPEDEITPYTSVSGYIFLRFFCPSILAPKLFDLIDDHPPMNVNRCLILIAKTLQNLANLVEFSGWKEEFMNDMNPFVLDHLDSMKNFIDEISSKPKNEEELKKNSDAPNVEVDKELAALYRYLQQSRHEMREYQKIPDLALEGVDLDALDKILDRIEEKVKEEEEQQLEGDDF